MARKGNLPCFGYTWRQSTIFLHTPPNMVSPASSARNVTKKKICDGILGWTPVGVTFWGLDSSRTLSKCDHNMSESHFENTSGSSSCIKEVEKLTRQKSLPDRNLSLSGMPTPFSFLEKICAFWRADFIFKERELFCKLTKTETWTEFQALKSLYWYDKWTFPHNWQLVNSHQQ